MSAIIATQYQTRNKEKFFEACSYKRKILKHDSHEAKFHSRNVQLRTFIIFASTDAN